MVVAAALAAFAVTFVIGCVLVRRYRLRLGPSWEDWRDAKRLGGRWSRAVGLGAGAATFVGLYGLGAPWILRAVLLGMVTGFCLPFATEGVPRYLRERRVPAGHDGQGARRDGGARPQAEARR
jgi:hypothetical protein